MLMNELYGISGKFDASFYLFYSNVQTGSILKLEENSA